MKILSSSKFFKSIVVLLVLEAGWIALTGRYPMAFDEDFHFGLIKLYAHHISPFWDAHPAGGDAFGALTRDPSYLYHYLMSFPYRLISVFTDSQTVQILILRALNIALFASSLPLFRRLLLKTGASRAMVHLSLLVFVLVPIVPLLAAQINYDNLIMPLTALALLLALRLKSRVLRKSFDLPALMQLLLVCLLASLVKYAFLPVFAVIVGFMAFHCLRTYDSWRRFGSALKVGWRKLGSWQHWLLIASVIVGTGLFIERYEVNLVRYHTPVADCAQVLSYAQCQHYAPWIRDYNLEQSKGPVINTSPLSYSYHEWFYGIWLRTFFAVDGPASNFETRGPLVVPGLGAVVLTIASGVALLFTARRLWRRYNAPALWLFSLASLCYIAALWLSEYQLFVQTGQPVAINGRYLLPVLSLGLSAVGLAVNELLQQRHRLKLAFAGFVLVCFIWGGGALTYILRSSDYWYWPNPAVKTANHTVKRVLGPITPGYDKPTQFIRYQP
ncbi:hypothetical protein COY17_01195 [Candidatus Saccharibacteria bacterium CG_4_10_14_0_2_um_filter_52_9]|nr:MAG: hypothetical protein COY17_01195 [Candidatus Saccharibacteria bacterium CG_4_10_14_0_2_um_filter_52_9]